MILFTPNTVIISSEVNSNFDELQTDVDNLWYMEIARTTLTVAGDSIDVSSIPARKYLKIIFRGWAGGGTLDTNIKFNGDAGANYAYYSSAAMAAGAASTGNANIPGESGATDSGGSSFVVMEVANDTAYEKLIQMRSQSQDAAGGGTVATAYELLGKWANTTAQINQITWTNTGTGDFAIGSEVIILGHD